jgi:hypothetical protein
MTISQRCIDETAAVSKEKPAKQRLSTDEARAFVHETNMKIHKIISDGTEHICDEQRWLIIGRCINLLISIYYAPIVVHAVEENLKDEL